MTTAPTARAARSRHGYSSLQIALHWTVAILVLVNWLIGGAMQQAFEALHGAAGVGELGATETEVAPTLGGAYAHVVIGLSVLILMIARLTARIRRPVATDPDSPHNGLHRILAVLGLINHWAFYGLLIVIPLLGALAWFGGSEAAGDLHTLLVTVTLWLVVIHVAAALFHHFVLRDGLIRRMLRPTGGT